MHYSFASFNFFLFGMALYHSGWLWPEQSKHRCQITSVKIILWINWDTHVLWVINFRLPSPFLYQSAPSISLILVLEKVWNWQCQWACARVPCSCSNPNKLCSFESGVCVSFLAFGVIYNRCWFAFHSKCCDVWCSMSSGDTPTPSDSLLRSREHTTQFDNTLHIVRVNLRSSSEMHSAQPAPQSNRFAELFSF